jgi:hypothetical protein
MNLLGPLWVMLSAATTQFVVLRSEFCCGLRPVEGEGQETSAVLVAAKMLSGLPLALSRA